MLNYRQPWRDVIKFLPIFGDLCGRTGASLSATCSIASAYSGFQASALKNNGVSGQHIDHHIQKREPVEDPFRGGKVRYRFSAFWLSYHRACDPLPFFFQVWKNHCRRTELIPRDFPVH